MRFRLLAALAVLSCPLFAATPAADSATPLDAVVPVLEFPAIDVDKALAEDIAKSKEVPGPVRYALGHEVKAVSITPDATRGGSWTTLADGRLQWQLEIHAKDAASIDLGFSKYRLPHGAELRIVDVHTGVAAGPFTDADNPTQDEFWTPIQKTDRVRLELVLPQAKRAHLWLTLDTVHHGYKDLFDAMLKSGSCNVDVICAAGDAWRDEIRSVAVLSSSSTGNRAGNYCSGTFMRSTAPSGPLFLSADHCNIDAASARVYFNFQNSVCRTPGSTASGSAGDGPLVQSIFGATLLATADPAQSLDIDSSDFALIRFNSTLPAAANVYLSGWDRRNVAPTSATVIHHPEGDEKRISFENDPLTISAYSGAPGSGDTHLRVADWDLGTTEQGSSGSGLWNQDHRLVGVLSGGAALCGNNDPDWFGRLAHAWEGLGTPQRRLKDWLDNGNTQVQTLDGVNASCQLSVTLDSPAFAAGAAVGSNVRFDATVGGATGALSYNWHVDDDGGLDRSTATANITAVYPTAGPRQVRVEVTDASGCIGQANRALDVIGPAIAATGGTPLQVCGDNDAAMEPGERWRVPVTLRNNGAAALPAGGRALFVGGVSTSSLPLGPNTFGYRGATSATGSCGYSFLDIANGADAVPALVTDDEDDGRVQNTIQLGGTGIELYGTRYSQAVMSTNGFISLNAAESGYEYFNTCTGELGEDGAGPQLRVFHDDLVVPSTAGAGLRYRYYASCPRAAESDGTAQGCHVFQWSHMQRYVDGGPATGDVEFQAVVYERSGQITYQYRTTSPDSGSGATVGITSPTGTDPLNAACNTANAVPAQSAICLYKPGATPGSNPGLRVETPAVSVPALAAGAQAVVDVPLAFATTGSCGGSFALNYRGTAAPGVSSPAATAVAQATLGAGGSCQVSNACPAQVPAIAARQGLYSNPARGGNGLANFIYGNAAYGGAWYTALADRTPTWYILAGDYANNLAAVPITRIRNTAGSTNAVATASENVGNAWVAQVDADNVVYAWQSTGGTPGIESMQSQGLPFTTPNHTQTWYAPSQSGWGLAIESLRTSPTSVLDFIGAYIYDAGGTARWLTGSSDNITGGPVNLTAYRVHCPGCPWLPDWAATGQPAGSLTRTYSGPMNGTLSTAIVLPGPLSGSWTRTTPLPITTIGTPVPAAPASDSE